MDFDFMADLYKEDPEKFEQERKRLVERAIAKAPERYRDRLTKMQWRIDMERKRCKTPLKSCIVLNDMMWESFHKLNNVLNEFIKEVN